MEHTENTTQPDHTLPLMNRMVALRQLRESYQRHDKIRARHHQAAKLNHQVVNKMNQYGHTTTTTVQEEWEWGQGWPACAVIAIGI